MQLYCDRCNETADHPIDISSNTELADLARDLGYRNVCPGCYDDLLIEAAEAREQQADDRRTEHRVAAQLPIRLCAIDGVATHETVTENISENGAQIRANLALEPGAVVRVESADGVIDAVAIVEVVWLDGGTLRAGLRLAEASESWRHLVARLEADEGE
jgi:hypothetical protein